MIGVDENKKNLIKICLYGGFFLIVILVAAISNRIGGNKVSGGNTNQRVDNSIVEKINNINDDYYSSKVSYVMDDDAISLDYQKVNEVEMGIKKYHGEVQEYTKYNDNYYKLDGEKFIRIDNFIDFDYDKTFMDIVNIKKLLLLDSNTRGYMNDDVNVMSFSYNLNDVLKIYNEFNNTNIIKYSDGEIILDIFYKDNEFLFLQVNVTDLYNLINEKTLENVIYRIEITSGKEEDVSWLIEKLD